MYIGFSHRSMKSGNSRGLSVRGISAGAPVLAKSTAMECRAASWRHSGLRAFSGSRSAWIKWAVEITPRASFIM
uniref:Uncharacterized protein n=1 Tax=Arundo donax TaxID=35708 RepID=A0A0A9E991_ARUDO